MSYGDLTTLVAGRRFGTVLVDPPWRFANRTGKMAPEHRRLSRYATMTAAEIAALPVGEIVAPTAHLYLWVPNALLPLGLQVMEAWGFQYKTNVVWHKLRKDGGSDDRGAAYPVDSGNPRYSMFVQWSDRPRAVARTDIRWTGHARFPNSRKHFLTKRAAPAQGVSRDQPIKPAEPLHIGESESAG